jgi:hypothetical protein
MQHVLFLMGFTLGVKDLEEGTRMAASIIKIIATNSD